MPRTLDNIQRQNTAWTAVQDLKAHRADLLIIMRRLDRSDLRLAHARLGASVTALDDVIATLEELCR